MAGGRPRVQGNTLHVVGLENVSIPIVVCNEQHTFLAPGACQTYRQAPLVGYPGALQSCNTAPALALAAVTPLAEADDPVMLVSHGDRVITGPGAFWASVARSVNLAGNDWPDRPRP